MSLPSDTEMMEIISSLQPNNVIHIYNFDITLLDRRYISIDEWALWWAFIIEKHRLTCHWTDFTEYLAEYESTVNTMVIITHTREISPGVKTEQELLTAFSMGIISENSGEIITTCGREFSSKIQYEQTGIEKIPLKIGLFVRCILSKYMIRQGVTEFYNDAANMGLVKYYSTLGYRLGKKPCGVPDDVTDIHEKYIRDGGPSYELYQSLPDTYWMPHGFHMKMCKFNDKICLDAIASLRRFGEILKQYDDVYWYGAYV